jgi:NAD(P)H-hydrate repair Nnr-like enzyme with NAD(P)H-hydrate dehydratase domain
MLEALRITLAGGHRPMSGAIRNFAHAGLRLGVGTCQLARDGQALRDHVVIAEPHERFGRPEDAV